MKRGLQDVDKSLVEAEWSRIQQECTDMRQRMEDIRSTPLEELLSAELKAMKREADTAWNTWCPPALRTPDVTMEQVRDALDGDAVFPPAVDAYFYALQRSAVENRILDMKLCEPAFQHAAMLPAMCLCATPYVMTVDEEDRASFEAASEADKVEFRSMKPFWVYMVLRGAIFGVHHASEAERDAVEPDTDADRVHGVSLHLVHASHRSFVRHMLQNDPVFRQYFEMSCWCPS